MPEGWAWCKLRDILTLIRNGATIKQSKDSKGLPITRIETISQGIIDRNKFGYADIFDEGLFKKFYLQNNDILMSHINSPIHLGKCAIYKQIKDDEKIIHGMNLLLLRFSYFVSPEFVMFVFKSSYFKEYVQMNMKEAVNQASISTKQISDCLIPMPPIVEQKQIVTEIEKFYQLIDTIENDKVNLQIAIKKAKSKILDLAIHGKLVPQEANDEPASVLLEKLRVEKEEKIAKGELKRDKNDSYIYKGSDNCYYQKFVDHSEIKVSDDIPFELPENWAWCHLSEVASKITDGEHNTPKRISTFQGFYLLSARNIQNGYISLDDVDYVDEQEFNRIYTRCNPQKYDVLISCSGSVGRCTIIEDDNKYVMVRSAAMVSAPSINTKYLMFVIQSANLQEQIQNASKQTAQANLFQSAIANLIIPIPPLKEQKRIVEKIENAFAKLDFIAKQLD